MGYGKYQCYEPWDWEVRKHRWFFWLMRNPLAHTHSSRGDIPKKSKQPGEATQPGRAVPDLSAEVAERQQDNTWGTLHLGK